MSRPDVGTDCPLIVWLLKNDPALSDTLFWVVGAGEPAWDEAPPDHDRGVVQLAAEVAREAVSSKDAVFLDVDGEERQSPPHGSRSGRPLRHKRVSARCASVACSAAMPRRPGAAVT